MENKEISRPSLEAELKELRKRLSNLEESEHRYKQLIENPLVGIWEADQEGRLVFINGRLSEMSGYSKQEALGMSMMVPMPLEKRSWLAERMEKRKKKMLPPDIVETEIVRKDGSRFVALVTPAALYDKEGRFRGYIGAMIDVTERKKAEEALQSAYEELETRVKERTEKLESTNRKLKEEIEERKRAEKALRESEDRYRTLVENLPVAVYRNTPGPEGEFLMANPAFLNMFGFDSAEELKDVSPASLYVSPGERKRFSDRLLKEKRVKDVQLSLKKKDGTRIWGSVTAQVGYDPSGRPAHFDSIVIDVTQQKRMREMLQESEERFLQFMKYFPGCAYIKDSDRRFIYLNDRFEQYFDMKLSDWLGRRSEEIWPPEVSQRIRKEDEAVLRGETIEDISERPQKDGTHIWLTYRFPIKRPGKPTLIGAISIDITDRERAEERLKESERRYRSLVETSPDGIFFNALDGTIIMANEQAASMLGFKAASEMDGSDIFRFFTEQTRSRIIEATRKTLDVGFVKDVECELWRKDKTSFPAEMSCSLIKAEDGSPANFMIVLRDISERKQGEQERRRLSLQLQEAQKMKAIGTLAGGIAHDFNNLLMGIQGYVSLMLLETEVGHPSHEKLKSIEELIRSGADLTKQLLGFARRGRYDVRSIDINELIESSSTMFGRTRKQIRIHSRYQEGVWPVQADRGQMEHALLNLYINAWQAMPQGGDLYLETENVRLDEEFANINEVKAGDYVKITLTDTGVGMDEPTRQRIFEPFFTTKEIGRGTGLGLASVYGIIKGHGGIIEVQSEQGQGSTFTIYLPASRKRPASQEIVPERPLRGYGTILLVDDEESILEVGSRMLNALGYDVCVARSGSEALEIFKESFRKIDLVILDMIMPGMGGSATFDAIKKIDRSAKVLLSSGYTLEGEASEIMQKGCDGFIQKPFDLETLSKRLMEILKAKKGQTGEYS